MPPRPRIPAPVQVLLLTAASALLVLVWPATAQAHDHLQRMSPQAGAQLDALPAQVSLTFDAAVGSLGSQVVVTDPAGARIDAGTPEVADRTITVAVASSGATLRGSYTVDYRIVSADGHVVSDRESFALDAGVAPSAAALPTAVVASDDGFVRTHRSHLVVAGGIAVVALGYLGFDLFRRRRVSG